MWGKIIYKKIISMWWEITYLYNIQYSSACI